MSIPAERLLEFASAAFERLGVRPDDAHITARCLLEADLEGNGSHGLIRLPAWSERVASGAVNATADPSVVEDHGSLVNLDGGSALGPVVGTRAMALAVTRAEADGIGACAVRNSNHLGALSFYVRPPAEAGLLALAFSNTPPAMAAPGGVKAFLGTNPLAAGIPTGGDPVIVDLATSQVARGRIVQAAKAEQAIPEGWALDSAGRRTTDPAAALEGFLEPLGGPKGFALALLVEALAGVLPGAAVGPEVASSYAAADRPAGTGHLFVAIRPGPGFRDRMTRLAGDLRATGVGVRLPGDRRHALRGRAGLDLPTEVLDDLRALGARLGLPAPA